MNSLYESFQKKNEQKNGFDLSTALQNLMKQIAPTGMSPEQIVRQKIQNGEMSQAQFEQLSKAADALFSQMTGKRR